MPSPKVSLPVRLNVLLVFLIPVGVESLWYQIPPTLSSLLLMSQPQLQQQPSPQLQPQSHSQLQRHHHPRQPQQQPHQPLHQLPQTIGDTGTGRGGGGGTGGPSDDGINLGDIGYFTLHACTTATCAGAASCNVVSGNLGVSPGTSITGNFA